MKFLRWLQESPFSSWVTMSDYGFYVCLTGHAFGMAIVVGLTWLLAIRLWGFSKDEPLLAFKRLFGLTWLGFGLNAITGVMLFAANGERLIKNGPFQLKLASIAAGGLAIWALWRSVEQDDLVASGASAVASQRTKMLALLACFMWALAIVAGRLIGYTIE